MHEKKDSFYFCCAEKDSLYALELLKKRCEKNELTEGEKRQLAFMERRMEENRIYLLPAVVYAAANQESFGTWLDGIADGLQQKWYAQGVVWMRKNPAFLEKFGWRERKNAIVAAGILSMAEVTQNEDSMNQVRRMMRGAWRFLWEKMKRLKALDARAWKDMLSPWADSECMSCGMAGVLLMMAALSDRPVLERDRIWRDFQRLGSFTRGCFCAGKVQAVCDENAVFSGNKRMAWLLTHFKNPQRPAYIRERERFDSEWLDQLHRIMELAGLPASACETMRISCSEVQLILEEMEDKPTGKQYITFLMLYAVAKELAAAGRAAAAVDMTAAKSLQQQLSHAELSV
ncbi:MAG: hypothetical protein IJ390_04245 [Lachnospiraceae bacterium]|nr:hypothetical protein [Lachnospiraceae bacterium]